MKGYVIQRCDATAQLSSRYYLLAADETAARASAATLLETDVQHVTVLRGMADWEVQVFCPFPNELLAAP